MVAVPSDVYPFALILTAPHLATPLNSITCKYVSLWLSVKHGIQKQDRVRWSESHGLALENEDLWKEEWAETYWESKDKFGSFIDIA